MAAPAAPAEGAPLAAATSHTLRKWIISDLREHLHVLEANAGPALRNMGATIRQLNAFQLFEQPDLLDEPSLVIMSCVWPPPDHREQLERLVEHYTDSRPTWRDVARFYDTMAFEAVTGQATLATVVSICRMSDYIVPGPTASVLAPLAHVPGYVAKQQYLSQSGQLQDLMKGHSLVCRAQTGGPIDPAEFIGSRGYLDLVGMTAAATDFDMKVIFIGEWDGALSLGCATGMLYHPRMDSTFLRPLSEWKRPEGPRLKVLGGYVGVYTEFHEEARDARTREILNEYLKNGGDASIWTCPTRALLQPHANLNAAVMWLHARVVAQGGPGGSYIQSDLTPIITAAGLVST